MSMGSFDPADWDCFASAAAKHPDILFVVSAGNDGRNLDQAPVFPAALPLENMVTVTSSDDFGRINREIPLEDRPFSLALAVQVQRHRHRHQRVRALRV